MSKPDPGQSLKESLQVDLADIHFKEPNLFHLKSSDQELMNSMEMDQLDSLQDEINQDEMVIEDFNIDIEQKQNQEELKNSIKGKQNFQKSQTLSIGHEKMYTPQKSKSNTDNNISPQSADKFYAMTDNFGEKSEMHEIIDITYHRNIKGIKGRQYYCVWQNHEPSWEFEKLIKSQCQTLISNYWLNIGKLSLNNTQRKFPDDMEVLKKNKCMIEDGIQEPNFKVEKKRHRTNNNIQQISMTQTDQLDNLLESNQPVIKSNFNQSSVLQISKKKLKLSTPIKIQPKKKLDCLDEKTGLEKQQSYNEPISLSQDSDLCKSPQTLKAQDKNAGITVYEDLETALLSNIGNWKKLKRQGNKDIYKCNECETLLEVERKVLEFKVRLVNYGSDQIHHNWFDDSHKEPFSNREAIDRSDKIHTSAEAFIKLQMRERRGNQPTEILECMRRERPQLYKYFRPTTDQIAYYIVSNTRELTSNIDAFDGHRITRSNKSTTPVNKFPIDLDHMPKKRDQKSIEKKQQVEYFKSLLGQMNGSQQNISEEINIQRVQSEEENEDKIIEEKPQLPVQVKTLVQDKIQVAEKLSKKQFKENSEPTTDFQVKKQKLPTTPVNQKTNFRSTSENLRNKRVKFNTEVEEAVFQKVSSDDEQYNKQIIEYLNSQRSNQKDYDQEDKDEEDCEMRSDNSNLHIQDNSSQNKSIVQEIKKENISPEKKFSQQSEDEEAILAKDFDNISSDEEEYQNGNFLEYIKHETLKAHKEREFVINILKSREPRGSIFIDKVKKVVTAVQRDTGKFDYLIEWEHCKKTKITPATSLVRGSHFVFSNPLQYRRYVEQVFMESAQHKEGLIVKK
eukprot:403352581